MRKSGLVLGGVLSTIHEPLSRSYTGSSFDEPYLRVVRHGCDNIC